MSQISDYVLPILLLLVMVAGIIKRVPLFDAFTQGAVEALRLVAELFPFFAAIFVCIILFRTSGLGSYLSTALGPVLEGVGIPAELTELMIIRPLSGSGSLAVLEEIYALYGADSAIARAASVLVGSSETVFYVSAVYFSTVPNKKLRYGIPIALVSTVLGAIVSCLLVRYL